MIRHGYPVPGIHWLFWNRPLQTPVAPFHSLSKSLALTGVPALGFHQRSAVGSGGGNFVYWIVSRISPVNWSGGGRSWPVTSPPRPPSAPTAPAAMPNRTRSRQAVPFPVAYASQLLHATPSD